MQIHLGYNNQVASFRMDRDWAPERLQLAANFHLEKNFKLKFPEGMTFDALVRDTKSLVTKLQKVDVGLVTQDQVVEQADEMGLELMTDDATGEIIIMDAKDAAKFVNLLNDDYMTSDMTGIKYELKGKKELRGDSEANVPEG